MKMLENKLKHIKKTIYFKQLVFLQIHSGMLSISEKQSTLN